MEEEHYGFVYLTTNKINGKRYIGQRYYDTKGKWKLYLGSGKILKDAIKKYGRENFIVEILENCKTKEVLNDREKYWIKEYNAIYDDTFYNIAMGGDGGDVTAGYSEERRNELKALHSRRSKEYIPKGYDGWTSKISKEEFEIILNMLIIGKYDREISKTFSIDARTINDIRLHKTWNYFTNEIEFPKLKRQGVNIKKPILQYDLNNNFIAEYESATDCEKETGIGNRMISRVCNGGRPHTHGFIFKFK